MSISIDTNRLEIEAEKGKNKGIEPPPPNLIVQTNHITVLKNPFKRDSKQQLPAAVPPQSGAVAAAGVAVAVDKCAKPGLFEQLWRALIRPPNRIAYSPSSLGPASFIVDNKTIAKREDFKVVNSRGQQLECSYFEAVAVNNKPHPCVLYLHGNSSSRIEGIVLVQYLIPLGISLVLMDFAGCGVSEGEFISLGYYERIDAKQVIEHVKQWKPITEFGIWGRSMGAATTLMTALQEGLSIRFIVIDSSFTSIKRLCTEIAKESYHIPKVIAGLAFSYIQRQIRKKAGFDLEHCDALAAVHNAKSKPSAMFLAAVGDTLISPIHSQQLFDAYRGKKRFLKFEGTHNSRRPREISLAIARFFFNGFFDEHAFKYFPPFQMVLNFDDAIKLELPTKPSPAAVAAAAAARLDKPPGEVGPRMHPEMPGKQQQAMSVRLQQQSAHQPVGFDDDVIPEDDEELDGKQKPNKDEKDAPAQIINQQNHLESDAAAASIRRALSDRSQKYAGGLEGHSQHQQQLQQQQQHSQVISELMQGSMQDSRQDSAIAIGGVSTHLNKVEGLSPSHPLHSSQNENFDSNNILINFQRYQVPSAFSQTQANGTNNPAAAAAERVEEETHTQMYSSKVDRGGDQDGTNNQIGLSGFFIESQNMPAQPGFINTSSISQFTTQFHANLPPIDARSLPEDTKDQHELQHTISFDGGVINRVIDLTSNRKQQNAQVMRQPPHFEQQEIPFHDNLTSLHQELGENMKNSKAPFM